MLVVCILAIIICLTLLVRVNYQKHCIEDLEARIKWVNRQGNKETINILYDIKAILDNYEFKSTREPKIREIVNRNIEIYSLRERNYSEKDFDEVVNAAGVKYLENEYKKELANDGNQ